MAEDSQLPERADEFVGEKVVVVLDETDLLAMLRIVAAGDDPDFVYAEFWANDLIQPAYEVTQECDCCNCEAEDDDDCECECECYDWEEAGEDDGRDQ